MEWAGEVAELGPDAKGVKVGDRIMGSGAAAFAEYTLADHGRLFRAPSNMNFDEAATLPVALATMHNAVVPNGALQPGQSVLLQGRDAPRPPEGIRRRPCRRLLRSRLGRRGAEGHQWRRRRPHRRSGLR